MGLAGDGTQVGGHLAVVFALVLNVEFEGAHRERVEANIADFGGITISYQAFTKTEQFKAAKMLEGFTPQQRFFLGFGRIWAGSYRDDAMRTQLMTNPHSPGKYRVNGTLPNVPQWYEAFGVKEGDKMYRAESDRAMIW